MKMIRRICLVLPFLISFNAFTALSFIFKAASWGKKYGSMFGMAKSNFENLEWDCGGEKKIPRDVHCISLIPEENKWKQIQAMLQSVCRGEIAFASGEELMLYIHQVAGVTKFLPYAVATTERAGKNFDFFFQLPKRQQSFEAEYFFGKVVPFTACLALNLPSFFPQGLPILKQQILYRLRLTKLQIAALNSAGFWGSISAVDETWDGPQLNKFDFQKSFFLQQGKLHCFLSYLCSISELFEPYLPQFYANSSYIDDEKSYITLQFSNMEQNDGSELIIHPHEEILDFELLVADENDAKIEILAKNKAKLIPILQDDSGLIEQADGYAQADFADKYIGGVVFGWDAVQEEIRFVLYPELMPCMLFVPRLADEEALTMVGAERFSNYTGYRSTFAFSSIAGPRNAPTVLSGLNGHGGAHRFAPLDALGRRDIHVVALDALDYTETDHSYEFTQLALMREFRKACAAFKGDSDDLVAKRPIATGNWGAGVFLGDLVLKALLQWLAACKEGKQIRYYSFKDPRAKGLARNFANLVLKYKTVGAIFTKIEEIGRNGLSNRLVQQLLHE